MPTYEYTCTDCGEPVEAVQKFSDAPLTKCAVCDGRLRKVFSPVGIVFKGSGFYRTDSRKGSTAMDVAAKDKSSGDSVSSSEPAANGSGTKGSGTKGSDSDGSGSGSNGSGSGKNGNGADRSAAKKSESASVPARSSSSTEKVA